MKEDNQYELNNVIHTAKEYVNRVRESETSCCGWCTDDIVKAFVAGAQWQKEIDSKAIGVADKAYFESCKKIRKQTIKKACDWWEKNDSYAVPTNVQIERFKQAMEEEV